MSTTISGAGVKVKRQKRVKFLSKKSSRHAGSQIAPGPALVAEVKRLEARSNPLLVTSMTKLPGQSKGMFATQPGKSPGLYLSAIARGTPGATIRPNRVTAGMEGRRSAVMSAGDVGNTQQRTFNRIAKFDMRGLATQGRATRALGRLVGTNQALLEGNQDAADLISGRAPSTRTEGYRATLGPADTAWLGNATILPGGLHRFGSLSADQLPAQPQRPAPSSAGKALFEELISGSGRRRPKGRAV